MSRFTGQSEATVGFTGWYAAYYASEGRHFDGSNIIYADGHVKWTKTGIIYSEAKKYDGGTHAKSAWDPLANN